MEKMIKKMMVAGLACVALCGSAMAAPKHGNGPAPKGKAPIGHPRSGLWYYRELHYNHSLS